MRTVRAEYFDKSQIPDPQLAIHVAATASESPLASDDWYELSEKQLLKDKQFFMATSSEEHFKKVLNIFFNQQVGLKLENQFKILSWNSSPSEKIFVIVATEEFIRNNKHNVCWWSTSDSKEKIELAKRVRNELEIVSKSQVSNGSYSEEKATVENESDSSDRGATWPSFN